MNIDTSRPPPALPVPQPQIIAKGITLLPPLSRRGKGPGLIIIPPRSSNTVALIDGTPSLLRKWAEEGYTVVQIDDRALEEGLHEEHIRSILQQSLDAIGECIECEPKGKIGIVAYEPVVWTNLAPYTRSLEGEIVATIVYTDPAHATITHATEHVLPTLLHIAGPVSSDYETIRSDQLTEYTYPSASSYLFATPFQEAFNNSMEAVSHTRNLTFLKKWMGGPWFDLEAIWDEHTYFEFENRSVEWTMSTMVDEPYVNHIPTITGGIGRKELSDFYTNHFIFSNPPDTELELISRTVGIDRVVDEFIFKLTHTTAVDWLLPGVPPTGKKLEIPMIAIVNIRGDRLYHEHIAWDQATVLRQLDLLPECLPWPYTGKNMGETNSMTTQHDVEKRMEVKIPAAGQETAAKMRAKNSVRSNLMFEGGGLREVCSK